MYSFFFCSVFFCFRLTPGALSPASNIIDNYFQRQKEERDGEGEAETNGIINICVYVLSINCILGHLFSPSFGACSQTVIGLIQALGGALVTIFNALFSGIIGYILASIIGAFPRNNKDLIGIDTTAPSGGYATHIEIEFIAYAMVRCWDIEFGENDHAVEVGNGGDPFNNERAEDRERIICFVAVMFFLLSIGLFMCLSLDFFFG